MTEKGLMTAGERVSASEGELYRFHKERYLFAIPSVKNKIVLDVACGTGYGTDLLVRKGKSKKVIGLDYDKKTISECKKTCKGEFIEGDATNLPFEDNYFDIVVSFETIEHIIDYNLFLKEIKRVLKKDGLVIMSTPNYKFEIIKNKWHVSNFGKKEFLKIFSDNFKEVKFYGQGKWYLSFPGRGIFERIVGKTRSEKVYQLKKKSNPQIVLATGKI